MQIYQTECQYCGHKIRYTQSDTQLKCYKCLTIHYRNGKYLDKKENLIYTLYPYLDEKLKVEKQNVLPYRNRHTV
jgi:reverse gyrase